MSRGKELAKNTAILSFGKLCTHLVSFVLLPFYTNILEPEEYGIANLFMTYISLIVPLFSLMIEQGLFRFLLDVRDERKRQVSLLSTVTAINIFEILIFILIYLIAARFIISEYKTFLLLSVPVYILMNTLMQFARGIGKIGIYTLASFISATASIVCNIITIFVMRLGVWGLFISTILGQLAALITLFFLLKAWRYIKFSFISLKEAKVLIRYSYPLVPNQLSWWAIGASDKTIVSYFISVSANGIYSVANRFSTIFITFYNLLNLSWTESVALHVNDEDAETFFSETINTMFSLFFSICMGIVGYMSIFFPLIINVKYHEAYPQIPILMLSVLFQVVVGLYSVIYVALKRPHELAKTSMFAAIINVVVDLLLIKYIGLYAASISTLVAFASMAIYRYFHVKKYFNIVLENKLKYLVVTAAVLSIYYTKNFYLNIAGAVFITAFAIITNFAFIKALLGFTLETMKKMLKK